MKAMTLTTLITGLLLMCSCHNFEPDVQDIPVQNKDNITEQTVDLLYISDIFHLPDPMWQESWGEVELLLVMRIDEPKFLVCYREATLMYESFKQLYTCSTFFYAHKFIHSFFLFIACF